MKKCHANLSQLWKVFHNFARTNDIERSFQTMMMKRIMVMAAMATFALAAGAQTEAQRNYLRKTRNVVMQFNESKGDSTQTDEGTEQHKDYLSRYFRYESMCDWKPGMRFMVIPEQRDLVIKTFADSTGRMIPNSALKYKVMSYRGHERREHELHERVNFWCEEDQQLYYFSVPTASFDDYCFSRAGVPTLAYLGDVDIARQVLVGKTVFTLNTVYYRDIDTNGDGFEEVRVPKNTECTVVDAGVGTRRFPVKLIVALPDSSEVYQYVAISRTNCGIRDEEFAKDLTKHDFRGSFELLADNLAASAAYRSYLGKSTYLLFKTAMKDANGQSVSMPRLSRFTIKDMRVQRGTEYVKLTLKEAGTGREYTKDVLVIDTKENANIDGQHNNIFTSLFAMGDPYELEGVKKQHIVDIQKGVVRRGFTEAEVELALGKPTNLGSATGQYTWAYQRPDQPYVCVYFNSKTKLVNTVKR